MVRFVRYGFARAGKVKNQTPKVNQKDSGPNKKQGRIKYRSKFNKSQNKQLKTNSELNKIQEKKAIEAETLLKPQFSNLPRIEADKKKQAVGLLFGLTYGKKGWRNVGLKKKRGGNMNLGFVGVWSPRNHVTWAPKMAKTVPLERWLPGYDWGICEKHFRNIGWNGRCRGNSHHQLSRQRFLKKEYIAKERLAKVELLQDILRTRDVNAVG